MRFAAVSDIHGNLAALEAVIADIAGQGVQTIVNLGDCLSGPLWPAETADRLMALGWPTIAGNHERQLLTQDIAAMIPSDAYAARLLTPAARDWLAALPGTTAFAEDVLLCHGTPSSDHRYWLHRADGDEMRETSPDEVAGQATGAMLALCGHTHLPRAIRLDDGRIVANPGSVGLPAYDDDQPHYHRVETGTPDARYLIAERCTDGWRIDLRTVPYDYQSAARKAAAAGRPDWAHALRTGYVKL